MVEIEVNSSIQGNAFTTGRAYIGPAAGGASMGSRGFPGEYAFQRRQFTYLNRQGSIELK